MGVNQSIDSLVTDVGIIVTRRLAGVYVHGNYVPGGTTTFTIDAVVQPAYNLNRVIGGVNLDANLDGQHATDIQQLHTRTELKTRTATTDPDILTFKGNDWTVARVERWDISGEVHYHCVVAAVTRGSAPQ